MKRIRIPGVVDIVSSDDPTEIERLARDPKLDRTYVDHSIFANGKILERVQETLQIGGRPLPTVAPRCASGRAEAQDALWKRLNAIAPVYASGPDELESLAAFVHGAGSKDACGPLVQQVVGRLFKPNFTATTDSWNAALMLDQALRTLNPALTAWWALTNRVNCAKQLLSDMVDGDLAAVHAIGVAVHNIVNGVIAMRNLYLNASSRAVLSPEAAGRQCIFAPRSVLRQPTAIDTSANGEFETATLVTLNLQAANAKSPDANLAFLRNTWSQCPAEQWVPAFLEGIWLRASKPQSQGQSTGSAHG